MAQEELPVAARVVVIGGGAMGCSTAYYLAKQGCADVVLLERAKLTSGTTWHSAAQVRQLRSSQSLTRLIQDSVELYGSLEAETGQSTGWYRTGSLSIATNPDRLTHIRRQAALARAFGIEVAEIDAAEAGRLWPLMRTDDVIGAVYSPDDGRVNPSDLCAALARGARQRGVRILEDTPVSGFRLENGRVTGVTTSRGTIRCEAVALCAGLWSREIALLAGVAAPLYACEHFYLLTKPIEGITGHLPTLSDHDGHLYIRDDVGGLLVGCFEPWGKVLPPEKLPENFAFELLNEDWDHFEPMMLNALHRVPALETAEARMLLNGPESFTPDGNFLLGEAAEVTGFFLGCGMNSIGVASAGGAGKALARWVLEGHPGMDLSPVDIRRFQAFQNSQDALRARVPEVLGLHYAIAYPGREFETARNLRFSPLHGRLKARGARFGQRAGWERPVYFTGPDEAQDPPLSFERPPWFEAAAAEHKAAREAVAVIDQGSFVKLLLQGRRVERLLQRLCANDVAVAPGRIVYSAMLNERGGFESDLTVLRLAEDSFLLVSGTGHGGRDPAWIRRHMAGDEDATLTDVTSSHAAIAVAGPRSRALLSRLSDADFGNDAFPYYTWQEIELDCERVRAARLSYVGELGWELYVPAEFAAGLYDRLCAAGEDLGLRDVGAYATTSLRIEKGYRAWGHDLGPEDTPLEAGLGFAVKLDRQIPFIGREALLRQREHRTGKRLIMLQLEDPDALPIGEEPILQHGRAVGQATSCAYGHSLGCGVAMGYVGCGDRGIEAMLDDGGFALDIAGRAVPARASLRAAYDPRGERLRR